MPKPPSEFPFQFRACRTNEDIQLITTSSTPAIISLIELFELEDEIHRDLKVLLDPATPERKTAVISLRSWPKERQNHAYTALLECDLCGVRSGFFAVFKSRSGDMETLTRECKVMYDFLNTELAKEKRLGKLTPLSVDRSS